MIIAKPIKKSISIPLQTFPTVNGTKPCLETLPTDVIHFYKRKEGDFIDKVFGKDNVINNKVDQVLSIITTRPLGHIYQRRTLECQACIYNNTVFLSSPFVGTNAGLLNWAPGDFQSCVTHLIELAEEKTGCSALVVAIDKQDKAEVNVVLRAFMYLGFEMMNPLIYRQDARFIFVGYEI
ncbi:uncharacterized protein BX664DRAFT_323425 [Halteromyces radiatus]|uniref:uncharacterized protein n=1 Tax=Halteromyces radiatus TaxID=101107 RepID=UPI00221F8535|nr:uncharacterized protein BX664DRAFT_323425 [Halteromyces radiatus]KAI8096230.1 hypothetical protein BX664DRAFT_323425 [Halteromyces radiatus]